MAWLRRLTTLPFRAKVGIAFALGVAVVLLVSTLLSFRYWQARFLEATEQQATLAAASTRAALESTLPAGRFDAGRRSLLRLVEASPVTAARVHGTADRILLSADPAEEGRPAGALWIPDPGALPPEGLLRTTAGDTVRVFLPLHLAGRGDAVLELELPAGGTRDAMRRGALLGHGLMLASFLAIGVVLAVILEHDLLTPIDDLRHDLEDRDDEAPAAPVPPRDEVGRLRASVDRLIERERQASRLAASRDRELAEREGFAEVGELAAEMAHEFKRPLASIRTGLDLLEQEYALDPVGRDVLGRVEHQLDRLGETMRDLFSLARPVAVALEPVRLEEVADVALMELGALRCAEGIRIERRYAHGLPPVRGDRHRLEQAFLNLATNAAEAMPDGGLLSVTIESVDDDPERVAVTVADTGEGIPPGEVERAIRPFYSTRPHGTGLGLPLVARIVSAHGGELRIESVPGEGTTVHLHFPIHGPVTPTTEHERWESASSSSTTTT